MNLYEIKHGLLNLKDIEFNRFQNWFDKFGYDRINKNAKISKIRQSVLKLSEKEFNHFWDWFDNFAMKNGQKKSRMIQWLKNA